ncbi:MAG: STAS domain-containing protein [Bryobacterales bacterium]|nr:STAS domain-containing protein [Bryobacterales bacterium]
MSLKVNVRQVGQVAVIDLSGKITLGEGSGTLRDTVAEVSAKGNKNILLNMADVSYIDSAGLGELVGSYTSVTTKGGQLKLEHLQSKLKDLMQITKLHTVFHVFEAEDEAIASY